MKLGGALDLLVQVACNVVGCRGQIGQGCVDFAAAILHEAQPDKDGRHQHGRNDEYQ
ncbi:hypothetical protein ACVMGC_003839 [Bradyrhizobium barranii subsp. barranii]